MGSQGGYSARSLMGGVDGLTQCWFLHRVSEANCSVSQSDQQSPVSSPYLTPLHYVQMALCRRHPRRSVFLPLCARLAGPGRRAGQDDWGGTGSAAALASGELK